MPFKLEDALNEASGGKFVKADKDWGEKVVVENGGKLITGQNPASGEWRDLARTVSTPLSLGVLANTSRCRWEGYFEGYSSMMRAWRYRIKRITCRKHSDKLERRKS